LALLLLLALPAAAASVAANTLSGVVIVVIDGDTVLFKPEHYSPRSRAFLKVRLADIDAPERGQPYGGAATRALQALVLNRRVEITTVATDAYGRKIARINRGSVQVNAELVRRGYAWAYGSIPRRGTSARSGPESSRASARSRRNAALLDAQHAARRAHRGLWRDPAPTPPWVWRRAQPARNR
jgi:endonuclease YncB( thermonuclease family)